MLAFEAFDFAKLIILKIYVSDSHPLQTGTRFIAKLNDPSNRLTLSFVYPPRILDAKLRTLNSKLPQILYFMAITLATQAQKD